MRVGSPQPPFKNYRMQVSHLRGAPQLRVEVAMLTHLVSCSRFLLVPPGPRGLRVSFELVVELFGLLSTAVVPPRDALLSIGTGSVAHTLSRFSARLKALYHGNPSPGVTGRSNCHASALGLLIQGRPEVGWSIVAALARAAWRLHFAQRSRGL